MRPIAEVAADMGLSWKDLEPYGRDRAKVPLSVFPKAQRPGKLIVVTAITPTPAGEGKTTTSVGLVQGLAKIGKRPVLTIRQPSLGPVFGKKGGGAGGGKATVEPSADINLHFNGDFHAVGSAHNLLAALADNAARVGMVPGFGPDGITWRRVTDAEDRGLRRIVTGLGGAAEGPLRETGYDISAASEVNAVLALSADYKDLRKRLESIVVGWTTDRKPVTAGQLRAVGAMMVLLKDALKPNLVQTSEGQPALIHTGPFGNIAHGCSSILADRLAQHCGDYVVTEAGFGADLGFEKFMDIKVRQGGVEPSAVVVVTTVRGLKWHGGIDFDELKKPDADGVKKGSANLVHAINVVKRYGLPAVVAINRFPDDTAEEIAEVKRAAWEAGTTAVEALGFAKGGAGMTELASAVVEAASRPSKVRLLYTDETPITTKVETLAKELYYAGSVEWGPMTRTTARRYQDQGWNFPICMAKTHLSISADNRLRGVPKGHVLAIGELRVLAGARQIVALAGNIITLPGLPAEPNAWDIDLTDDGKVTGLLGA